MKKLISLTAIVLMAIGVEAQTEGLQPVIDQYMLVKDALVASDAAAAAKEAGSLLASVETAKLQNLVKDTKAIAGSTDLKKQREAFASLSSALYIVVKTRKGADKIYYQRCPMYNSGKGGNWLSKDSEVKNPFYGDMMLSCGKTVETIQ
jgi:Protein of unknown function (DUF3347)